MLSRIQRAAVLAVAALTVCAVVAAAQDAKPAPDCQGASVSDPKDDAERASTTPSPGNMDITSVFFTSEGSKTYANMQLADASDTLPPAAQGARWYILFNAKKADRWVRAYRNFPGATTFEYGHMEESETGFTRVPDGEVAGKFFTGPDGVLQLNIPAVAGGSAGERLSNVYADTAEAVGAPGVRMQLIVNDRAPDEADTYGKAYNVNGCESGGSGDGGGGGGAPPPPPSGQPILEPAALPVTVSGKAGSAKRSAKKRKATLAIESSQPVKDLVARLFKGDPARPKVYATGALASLNGKGKLPLKVKRKPRLKKGAYSLRIDGTLADGRKGTKTFKVKFRK